MRRPIALVTSLALLIFAAGSCSPADAPTAPARTPAPSSSLLGGLTSTVSTTLFACAPQPYAADTAVVGPAGGTLVIGPHRLAIPAGALSRTVTIIGEAPVDTVVSVRFQPEGLTFDPSHLPRLTLDYSHCTLVSNLVPKQIVYTTDALSILNLLPSIDDLLHRQVSANIKHFSRYAVAW